jgi:hypothetical protein
MGVTPWTLLECRTGLPQLVKSASTSSDGSLFPHAKSCCLGCFTGGHLKSEPPAESMGWLPHRRVTQLVIRTYLPLDPIGREAEVEKLTASITDLVVFGQPGSGKTHLLAHIAKSTDGLFLAATSRAAIADGIRQQQPKGVIVDDAFSRLDLLRLLRQNGYGRRPRQS